MEEKFAALKSKLKLNWKSSPKRTMVNDTFKAINLKTFENALHLLMVFCGNNKIILGHVNVNEKKTNEIPCAQALVSELGILECSVYTLDALHCQKKLSIK